MLFFYFYKFFYFLLHFYYIFISFLFYFNFKNLIIKKYNLLNMFKNILNFRFLLFFTCFFLYYNIPAQSEKITIKLPAKIKVHKPTFFILHLFSFFYYLYYISKNKKCQPLLISILIKKIYFNKIEKFVYLFF